MVMLQSLSSGSYGKNFLLNAYQHEDDRIHKVIIRDQPNSRKNVLFHNGFLKIRRIS